MKLEKSKIFDDQIKYNIKTIDELKEKIEKSSSIGERDYLRKEIKNYQIELDKLLEAEEKKQPSKAKEKDKETIKMSDKLVEDILKANEINTIKKLGELFKEKKISQIVIHAKEDILKEKESGHLSFESEPDTQYALYILNNLIKKSGDELYAKGAKTTLIPKGGSKKDLNDKELPYRIKTLKNEDEDGITLFLDVGGNWPGTEENNGKTIANVDHHGKNRAKFTSATEQIYEITKMAGLIEKPEPKWLKNLINFTNEIDNLSYLEKEAAKGKKIYDKEFFENKEKWARTPYALAEVAPMKILEALKSGKIKDLSEPLTEEQLKELSDNKIDMAKKSEEKAQKIKEVLNAINVSERNNKEIGLNLENTYLGKIIYHNFPKIQPKKGKEFKNTINNHLAFIGTKASNADTYVTWNSEKGTFFINSMNPNLEEIVEKLNKADPKCALSIRGVMVKGTINNLTEEQFLNIIDPNIIKNAKKGAISNEKVVLEPKNKNVKKIELKQEEKNEKKEITEEAIAKRAYEIYEKRKASGEEGDEKSDWFKAKAELEKESNTENKENKEETKGTEKKEEKNNEETKVENEEKTEVVKKDIEEKFKKENDAILSAMEKDLSTAREKYATGYKAFMAERKKNSGWLKNTWRKIVGDKVKEEDVPEELKNLEKEYDEKAIALGKKMYEDKKQELLSLKTNEETLTKELNKYKQTEIFNKIIINEQKELNALKAENLPPKEKSLLKKTLDWYMRQSKTTKILISVALTSGAIALVLPSSIAAAGGATTYLSGKLARSVIGGTVGQIAAKGYDVLVKDRTGKRRIERENSLKTNFNDAEFNDFSQIKKDYAGIVEQEATEKRNRLLHKAMVSVVAGGAASIGTGAALNHYFPAENIGSHGGASVNPENSIKVPPQTPEFKPESVAFSSKGAIATIENLKDKISHDYPDISKAPHSIQEFMKTDSTKEAIRLGFFDPNNPNESAMLLKGSTLDFDKNGNLSYHDIKTGETHSLIQEKGNLETTEKYTGKMFDSENSPKYEKTNIENSNNIEENNETIENKTKTTQNISDKEINTKNINEPKPKYGKVELKNTPENIVDNTPSKHFTFENKDNIIELKENDSSLKMQFIYDKNGEIVGTDVDGHYNNTDPYEYINKKTIDNLGSMTKVDANKDIFMMTNEARFLKTLPHDTYEYKFLHERVAGMQKDIINEYGPVLNEEKLEGDFYNLKVGSEAANHLNPKMLSLVNDTYESNIKNLFPDKKSMSAWSIIKDSTDNYSAEKLIKLDPTKVNESLNSPISFMQKIHEVTKLDPKTATSFETAESPTKYIRRGLMKAAQLGKLKELTLK